MAAQYFSIFTEQGLALLREAIQNGTKLGITSMSFGDGNGAVPTPQASFTSLVHEVYKTSLNRLAPSSSNANWLEADAVIPSAVGGFNIREVGLWAGNTLVAYANYPATYKPSADQGTAQIKTIRIVLQIDNTANFELKIDASVVMATVEYVNELNQKLIKTVSSVNEMIAIENPTDGTVVCTKSYHQGLNKGGNTYYYDSSQSNSNDGGTVLNGWKSLDPNIKDATFFGAKLDGVTDDTTAVIKALNANGIVSIYGDTVLDRIGFDEGWRIEGKANIKYLRKPNIPCVLDTHTPQNLSKMKAVYVFAIWDLCELLQIKTAGYNTIIHYGYALAQGGNFTKVCNVADALGLKVIINSPNDVPPANDLLLQTRECVIGYYLVDEPQHNNISVSAQDLRISAWRAVTNKLLCTADNGVFGFENPTFSSNFDLVFVDYYYLSDFDDAVNKINAVMSWNELMFKCGNAKIIPCVGLFTDTSKVKNKAKQIKHSQEFFKMSDGALAAFAWDSKTSDPTHVDIVSDQDFYLTAKELNKVFEQKKYDNQAYIFSNGTGISNLLEIYNQSYSGVDIKPFTIIQSEVAIDERRQVFGDKGIAFRNAGGDIALKIKNFGYMAMSFVYRNHVDDTAINLKIYETQDDFYSKNYLSQKSMLHRDGYLVGCQVQQNYSVGLEVIAESTSPYFFKFLSGAVISNSWVN